MALNDWNEEDHRNEADDEGGTGRMSGRGIFVLVGLAGLYLVLVVFLLDALKI